MGEQLSCDVPRLVGDGDPALALQRARLDGSAGAVRREEEAALRRGATTPTASAASRP